MSVFNLFQKQLQAICQYKDKLSPIDEAFVYSSTDFAFIEVLVTLDVIDADMLPTMAAVYGNHELCKWASETMDLPWCMEEYIKNCHRETPEVTALVLKYGFKPDDLDLLLAIKHDRVLLIEEFMKVVPHRWDCIVARALEHGAVQFLKKMKEADHFENLRLTIVPAHPREQSMPDDVRAWVDLHGTDTKAMVLAATAGQAHVLKHFYPDRRTMPRQVLMADRKAHYGDGPEVSLVPF